jgi:hypothetical protein
VPGAAIAAMARDPISYADFWINPSGGELGLASYGFLGMRPAR